MHTTKAGNAEHHEDTAMSLEDAASILEIIAGNTTILVMLADELNELDGNTRTDTPALREVIQDMIADLRHAAEAHERHWAALIHSGYAPTKHT